MLLPKLIEDKIRGYLHPPWMYVVSSQSFSPNIMIYDKFHVTKMLQDICKNINPAYMSERVIIIQTYNNNYKDVSQITITKISDVLSKFPYHSCITKEITTIYVQGIKDHRNIIVKHYLITKHNINNL